MYIHIYRIFSNPKPMKPKLIIIAAFMIFGISLFSCKNEKKTTDQQSFIPSVERQKWAIVIHGGAGVITRDKMTPEGEGWV